MKKLQKGLLLAVLAICLSMTAASVVNGPVETRVSAHPGRTDANGGHRDNKNKSGLGGYHYHCGGYPAHLHKRGVCPYKKTSSNSSSSSNKSYSNTSKTVVKQVQQRLNKLGYNCGKADGKIGSKTRTAIKKYQKKKKLEVNGLITVRLRKSLGLL